MSNRTAIADPDSERAVETADLLLQGLRIGDSPSAAQAGRSGNPSSRPRRKNASTSRNISKLQSAIDEAGFTKFRCVSDLGYVAWRPTASLRNAALSAVTAADIKANTISNSRPERVVDPASITLPMPFPVSMPKQTVSSKFPYGQLAVVHLYNAIHNCKVDKSSLDFFIGGSALGILSAQTRASRKGSQYLAMKVPGTNAIMLQSFKTFVQDYSAPGFQLERLLLGKRIGKKHDTGSMEHMQLMDIGGFRVLTEAEVDGMDKQWDPVDIQLGTKVPNRKILFRMIASGSLTLLSGIYEKGSPGVLKAVESESLADIAQKLTRSSGRDLASLEENIVHGMERLKQLDRAGCFEGGKVYQVDFNSDNAMELTPFSDEQYPLLPPEPVLQKLFQ